MADVRFAEALRRLEAIELAERSHPELDPDNAARWWLHDGRTPRAVVLLHGLTNTPQQYSQLAPLLFADGHNVIVPRFPYHGYRDRMTTALERLTLDDLIATALEAITVGALLAERVDLIGASVGGTLAAWLSLRVALDHVIAVAPFFGIIYLPGVVSDALAAAFLRFSNTFVWWDPIRQENQLPLHAYPRFSTRALARALTLSARFEHDAPAPAHADRLTLLLNAREPIVSNPVAVLRAEAKLRGDFAVDEVVLADLPFQHDILEPTLPRTPTSRVYDVLRSLVSGPRPLSSFAVDRPPVTG